MFVKALKFNLLMSVVWWLLFYPGFYSADSLYFVKIARSEIESTTLTPLFQIYLKTFTLFGAYIPLVTLVNVLILAYATTQFFFSLCNSLVARIGSSLLCATPLIGSIGITLWQDVPFAAGMLLLVSFFIGLLNNYGNSKGRIAQLLIPGTICANLRPNGFVTIVLFGLVLLIFFKRNALKSAFFMCLFSTTLSLGIPLLQNQRIADVVYAQTWMRYDVMCYLAQTDVNVKTDISDFFPSGTENWQSKEACSWFANSKVSGSEIIQSTSFIPSAWFKIAINHPEFLVTTHLHRHAYLSPIPVRGLPRPPFIHTVIDENNYGLAWSPWSVSEELRIIPRVWNYFNFIFAWSGLWWAIIFLLFIFQRRVEVLIPLLISTLSSVLLFIAAPISDARYSLHILIMGQALLTKIVIEKIIFLSKQSWH